jgi:hypothetical protein
MIEVSTGQVKGERQHNVSSIENSCKYGLLKPKLGPMRSYTCV